MVFSPITPEEQEKIFIRLLDFYKKLYPSIAFKRDEKILSKKDIINIYYTYPGEEEEANAKERMATIRENISRGYNTPIIILKKKNKMILIDGHRRIRVAFETNTPWKALLIVPQKDSKFGIEDTVNGKIKDLFGKKADSK